MKLRDDEITAFEPELMERDGWGADSALRWRVAESLIWRAAMRADSIQTPTGLVADRRAPLRSHAFKKTMRAATAPKGKKK